MGEGATPVLSRSPVQSIIRAEEMELNWKVRSVNPEHIHTVNRRRTLTPRKTISLPHVLTHSIRRSEEPAPGTEKRKLMRYDEGCHTKGLPTPAAHQIDLNLPMSTSSTLKPEVRLCTHHKLALGPRQYFPSPISKREFSIFTASCHLPKPGQKFSYSPVSFPSSSLCLRSIQPRWVREEYCTVEDLHHCSVPTTSGFAPCGTGGCTSEVSTPKYSNHFVDSGKEGTRGTVLKVAWNSGVVLGDASAGSPLVSCGKTLHCFAPFGRSFHSNLARCFGIFQSCVGLVSNLRCHCGEKRG